MRIGLSFILLLFAARTVAPSNPVDFALVGATVFDATGRPPIVGATLVVSGDRIVAVGPAGEIRILGGASVIDVGGKWITPGLVDAHIHFFQSGGLYTRPDIIDLRAIRPYADEVAEIRANVDDTFRRYLASGVTAVVDNGGPFWNFAVRDYGRTSQLAPRIAVAGPLISTVACPQLDIGDPPIILAETPEKARQLVQQQLRYRPDMIKAWFITGGTTWRDALEIVTAVVDEAHRGGARMAVHALDLESARASVEAGADILVHSVGDREVDEAFINLVKSRNVLYQSTAIVYESYGEVLSGFVQLSPIEQALGAPYVIRTWAEIPESMKTDRRGLWRATTQLMSRNFVTMQRAGVTVAVGTDAGNIGTLHGPSIHHELQLLIESGLSPEAALIAVTRGGSRVFSPNPEFGTLEPGKLADLLILDANPLEDIANLSRSSLLVLGGRVIDPKTLLSASVAGPAVPNQ